MSGDMRGTGTRYESGDEIKAGDRVDFAGSPGVVLFVLGNHSFLPEHSEEDWSYLGTGFMVEVESMGWVFLPTADEDLLLVSRADPRPE